MSGHDLPGMHHVGRFDVFVPDGMHLAPSRVSDDGFRGSALDDTTNIIAGQGELFPADGQRELTPEEILRLIAAGAVLVVGTTAVCKAGEIKDWWDRSAAPTVKAKWRRLWGDEAVEDEIAAEGPVDLDERRARKRASGSAAKAG